MKRVKWLILLLVPIGLLIAKRYTIIHSLENPFDEIVYSEIDQSFLYPLPDFSELVTSSQSYRTGEPQAKISLPSENSDEEISSYFFHDKSWLLEYRKQVADQTYLFITYHYEQQQLVEEIELSNSDISSTYALQTYKLGLTDGNYANKQEALSEIYWFSSSKGFPSLQLTDPTSVLDYLKPYGIDAKWIQEKADYMLNDIVLTRWFDKGSKRYSFDKLGKVDIVPLKLGE